MGMATFVPGMHMSVQSTEYTELRAGKIVHCTLTIYSGHR